MELYQRFAEILTYPTPSLHNQADDCVSLLPYLDTDAVSLLNEFQAFLKITTLERIEEIYTRTFDLQAICHPYVGYHLFGNGSQRGTFMVGLKEHYRTCGLSVGNELPDHISIMLRFASTCTNAEKEDLTSECIVPAVRKMISEFEDGSNPYRGVLQALLLVLRREGVDQTNHNIGSEGFHNGR
jgi:nitrate reductase molybdenum cofactor assembly chaperone NarJ/NarW